jgi:hypothetical protein
MDLQLSAEKKENAKGLKSLVYNFRLYIDICFLAAK